MVKTTILRITISRQLSPLVLKIENERAVQFRKWAREFVKEYTIKGFAMDDERMKRGGSIQRVRRN